MEKYKSIIEMQYKNSNKTDAYESRCQDWEVTGKSSGPKLRKLRLPGRERARGGGQPVTIKEVILIRVHWQLTLCAKDHTNYVVDMNFDFFRSTQDQNH